MKNLYRILAYFKEHKLMIGLAITASVFVSSTDAAIAYLAKDILDGIFIAKDMDMLRLIPIALIVLFSVRCVSRFVQSYCINYAGQKAIQRLRNEMYSKLLNLPMSYFDENSIGIMMTKVINDAQNLQNAVSSLVRIFRSLVSVIFLTALVLYHDAVMGLSVFLVTPMLILVIGKSGKKIKRTSRKIQEYTGLISDSLSESFSGIRVVKSFGSEDKEFDKFQKAVSKEMKYKLKQAFIASVSSPLIETVAGIAVAGIILYGGVKVMNGETTAGTFFSFLTAFGLMFEPFKKINNYNRVIQTASASAERIFSVLDTENKILENNGSLRCDAAGKTISFDNVSFAYKKSEPDVIKDFTLNVEPGTTVAVIGASGAGKSTLLSLIPRFYDITGGSVKIGGTDIRDFDISSLRRNISMVSQSPFIFNNTVRNNIAYGNNNASEAAIRDAAKAAYAEGFISELPDGYDTLLGERGSRLSGGQKQRITIARALLMDPPILLLDEATSALDTESEKIVQNALENLMKKRTSFVIAHRLSTVLNADMIVVLDEGRINAVGKHSELLEKSDLYYNLFQLQFCKDREV